MRVLLVFLFALTAAATEAKSYGGAPGETPSFAGRWFADNSPWNLPITDSTPLAYNIVWNGSRLNMNVWNVYTPAVVLANSNSDSLQDVSICIEFNEAANCDPENPAGSFQVWTLPDVPVPAQLLERIAFMTRVGEDNGMTCMWDAARGGFYDFWQPAWNGTTLTITTGGFTPLTGSGFSQIGIHSPHRADDMPGLGRAQGASYCGGLILRREMAAGVINHALAIMLPSSMLRISDIAFPSVDSDGTGTDPETTIPYGSLIQLDPSLTDAQLTALGLNSNDLIVAHAMQKYGAYVVDSGPESPSPGAVCFESDYDTQTKQLNVTSPWPTEVTDYFRVVQSPANPGNTTLDANNAHSATLTYP